MRRILLGLVIIVVAGLAVAQDAGAPAPGLPDGPTWGRGRFQPEAANVLFATGDGCALCHSAAPKASAMRTATGDDASPHGLWRATMMANAFRDPYWRAKVAQEVAAAPEKKVEIEALCLRCHGPMVSHTARIAGEEQPPIATAAADPLAQDGVSCTVCHQAHPDNLGTAESFSGRLDIRPGRRIFGPYEEPSTTPMRAHSAFTPEHGGHVQDSALCGACHTLFTKPGPDAAPFPEQTPYLEWRNSAYTDESGRTETSRTCQECHMVDIGTARIARNPMGRDFNIATRPNVRAHGFLGGNAFMLDLLAANRDELGVTAPQEALERSAAATRRFLRDDAASIEISSPTRADGRLSFDVTVVNKTGHKLPTAYPARRLWLRVQVRAGRSVVWESGGVDDDGRLRSRSDTAHRDIVDARDQVQVWECRAIDGTGAETTLLHAMAGYAKDDRLLPLGWRADGPHADQTRPVGVDGDDDFGPGRDTVSYRAALPDDAPDELLVVVWLLYQTVPPAWVDPLRPIDTPETTRFVRMYDAADKTPETLALGTRFEGR